jgi:hypothetical protein
LPIRVDKSTVIIHFKERNGIEVPDASFEIVSELNKAAFSAYTTAMMRLRIDANTQTLLSDDADVEAAENVLVLRGLISWEGVEDDQGQVLPLERWRELPLHYAQQIVNELQERNAPGEVGSPNGGAPSAAS